MPGLQLEQEIAPAEGMNEPSAQLTHAALFELPWKVPGLQLAQAASPGAEYMPAAQPVHISKLNAPSKTTNRPARQFVQIIAPEVSAYMPAEQLSHALVLGERAYIPTGQAAQFEAPTPLWYNPGPQSVQAVALGDEYDPAGHASQAFLPTVLW